MAKRGVALVVCASTIWFGCGTPSNPSSSEQRQTAAEVGAPILLPTGALITPLEAEGATFQALNPGLPNRPDFTAGQATSTALSPDGRLLLVLTTGYNRNYGPDGRLIPSESNEYVFIFDVSTEPPVQQQVLQVPNTFHGIAWSPAGDRFVVSGGPNDNIHIYDHASGEWAESFAVSLRHSGGLGLGVGPQSAGLAIKQSGNRVVVANFENDSVCIVDLGLRAVSEVELRPGKIDPQQRGVPGGEFPFWVATQGDDRAYVTSMRDREADAAGDRCRGARGTGRHLLCRVPLGCGVAPGALGAQLWLLRGFGPLRACRRRSAVCANRDQSGRAGHPAILPDQGLAPGHYRPVLPWLRPEAGRLLQLPRVGARVRPVRGKRRSPGARIRPIPA